MHHPDAAGLEEWICTKDYVNDEKPLIGPKWHVPNKEEVHFANELLDLHFQSALDDLLRICQTKMHSDPGDMQILLSSSFSLKCNSVSSPEGVAISHIEFIFK